MLGKISKLEQLPQICSLISDGFPAQLPWSFLLGVLLNASTIPPTRCPNGPQWPIKTQVAAILRNTGWWFAWDVVHLLKKKIPVRKGGSITPYESCCSLLGESNISKLVVGEPRQICNIGFRSSCACISVIWKSVSKATVTWVRWGNPLILGNLRTKSLSWTFRPFWNARIPRKLFEPYLWDPWNPPLPGRKIS